MRLLASLTASLVLLLAISGCAGNAPTPPDGTTTPPPATLTTVPPVTPVQSTAPATPGSTTTVAPKSSSPVPTTPALPKLTVLVDSSRDGGVWWYPQSGSCDPAAYHQGKMLADYLRSLGFSVDELSQRTAVTPALLQKYDAVIRASGNNYDTSETAAYHTYVHGGGKLVLLQSYMRPGNRDKLAESFGIVFSGISGGDNVVARFSDHPITAGLYAFPYGTGSGVTSYPGEAQIVGWLSDRTFLDFNDNQIKDGDDYSGAPALGCMPYGNGRIVFFGCTIALYAPSVRPLVRNIFVWLTQ
jgi:hypothetical protein